MSHAENAQRAAEEWLGRLDECLYLELEGDDDPIWPAELLAPYDGCDTCRVRETLVAAAPHLYLEALEALEAQGQLTAGGRRHLEKFLPKP